MSHHQFQNRRTCSTFVTPLACVVFLLVATTLTSTWAQEKIPEPSSDVTRYLKPLQQHQARLKEIHDSLNRMQGSFQPANEELLPHAQALIKESIEYRNTLHAFCTSKVRRGLTLEVDLANECFATIEETGNLLVEIGNMDLRQLQNGELSVSEQAERYVKEFVQGTLHDVAEELLAEQGLQEILNAEGWEDAHNTLTNHLRSRAKNLLEAETYKVLGIAFHDVNSAKIAIRRKVFDNLDRIVTKYVFKVTGDELIIVFVRATIMKWVVNDLYPKLREALRPKGNLEFRIEQSLGTFKTSRDELNKLGSENVAPADVPLRDVRKAMNLAVGRRVASRYLERDLRNAKRDDLLKQLVEGRQQLERTEFLTQTRFMLDKAEAIEKLKAQDEHMAWVVTILRMLERELGKPETRLWAVWHRNQTNTQGPTVDGLTVRNPFNASPYEFNRVLAAPSLYTLDRKILEKLNRQHAAKGLQSEPDFRKAWVRCNNRVLYRLTWNGQIAHGYQSGKKSFGIPRFTGLDQGQHLIGVEAFIEDGPVVYQQFWIDVGHKADAAVVARFQDELERLRIGLQQASAKDINNSAGFLIEHLHFGARGPAMQAAYPADAITEHLNEALELIKKYPEFGPDWNANGLTRFIDSCSEMGSSASYELAQRAIPLLEQAVATHPESSDQLVRGYSLMANLAITSSGDIDAARTYFIKYYDKQKELGRLKEAIYERLLSELPTPISSWTAEQKEKAEQPKE